MPSPAALGASLMILGAQTGLCLLYEIGAWWIGCLTARGDAVNEKTLRSAVNVSAGCSGMTNRIQDSHMSMEMSTWRGRSFNFAVIPVAAVPSVQLVTADFSNFPPLPIYI